MNTCSTATCTLPSGKLLLIDGREHPRPIYEQQGCAEAPASGVVCIRGGRSVASTRREQREQEDTQACERKKTFRHQKKTLLSLLIAVLVGR
jgi:hypothetical protein